MEGTKVDDLANFLSVRIAFSMTGCNIVKHALRTTLSKTTTLKVETAEDFNDAVIEVWMMIVGWEMLILKTLSSHFFE